MKNKMFLTVAIVASAIIATAAPGFRTLSGSGNATTPASVILPADPTTTARIVTVNWGSDTNNAVLSISEGLGVYNITQTNALSSSVTNLIDRTNGLTAGSSVLVLQHGGVCYAATVSTFNASPTLVTNGYVSGGTNVVLASGGWGTNTSIGDSVYLMSTPATLPIGATTNFQSGVAIYSATYQGRPIRVQLTPALATNKLFSVIGRYE